MHAGKWGQLALVPGEVECYCGGEHHDRNSCGQGGRVGGRDVMGGGVGCGGGGGGGVVWNGWWRHREM